MKLSLNWLSDFVSFSEKDPQKIAEALTLSVAEVEEVEVQGALLENCCVGKVLTIEKHPNADKLKLCNVETNKGKKRVVCGGTNLREGMLVAFAHIGARVKWHGEEMMELKKTKIRGEESEGMICASSELDITAQFPGPDGAIITDLGDSGYEVGKSLKEALGLNDVIFHVDNHALTQRADLFSHVGFARECVAIGIGKWKNEPSYKAPKFGKSSAPFKFVVDAPKGMPKYCSAILEIDGLGETPDWMVKRLEAVGWRSLNLPIDITNYVATEVGVPLHSFDSADFRGNVHMREAKEGEKIVTLDDTERKLPKGALVLSDDEGIFDLLGIMGGLRSSTKESTRQIYLHSASLDPVAIRSAVIATGHRTDAATVYEKGVPHIISEQGFYRALELFLELVPGAKIISKMESRGDNGKAKPIELSLERTSSLLGREIKSEEATKALKSLGFDVKKKGKALTVTPPLYRLNDIKEFADLAEEIARVAGFASFKEEMPCAGITPPLRDHRTNNIRDSLKEAGFTELLQFSFIGEEFLKKAGLKTKDLEEINNPLGEDIKLMRPSLLPRLLEFAEENIKLVQEKLMTFEIGRVFKDGKEEKLITVLIANKREENLKEEPFLIAKASAKEALGNIGVNLSYKREKKPSVEKHEARSAEIHYRGKQIGSLYEVHPAVCKSFGLPARAAVLELSLDLLLEQSEKEKICESVSEFPSISYDTTVSLASDTEVDSLLKKAQVSHEFLRRIELADLYKKGKDRQITFRCTYGSMDRTLTEEEVKPVHEKVESLLKS
jgi:phenylalanyl-tRNA synthetase beta chain